MMPLPPYALQAKVETLKMENAEEELVNCSVEVVYPTLPHPSCIVDSNTDEIVVAILIILLVIYTFYRLLHVWAYTLNFSEVCMKYVFISQHGMDHAPSRKM